eukprot:s164_g65.t1
MHAFRAEPHSNFVEDVWVDDFILAERSAAAATLRSLREALLSTCEASHSSQVHLWKLALSRSSLQDASACIDLLRRQDVALSQEYIPGIAAMLSALCDVVVAWRSSLRVCVAKQHARLGKMGKASMDVSAAASGPPLRASSCSVARSKTEVCGFMLNFGYSGGMNPAGTSIATQRWWDVAMYLQALHAEWGFAVGCRRPENVIINEALPGYPYMVFGHDSIDYDAISIFCLPCLSSACLWLPQFSKSSRTCWVQLGASEVWSCLYVPPYSSDRSRERCHVIEQYFREWDEAWRHFQRIDEKEGSKTLFRGCGDLNMRDDISAMFERCLTERGLDWSTPSFAPTHVLGGILDYFWHDVGSCAFHPILHDGTICRQHHCSSVICGHVADVFDSHDLDHFPWTFHSSLEKIPGGKQSFGAKFVKDPDAWSAAVLVHGEEAFQFVSFDLNTAMQMKSLFPSVSVPTCRRILSSCAIMWEVVMTLIGYCSGLVTVKPLQRTPRVPREVKEAFQFFIHAAKACSKQLNPPESCAALSSARAEYRAAVRKHRWDVLQFRACRYIELCSKKTSDADAFLAKCLRKNKPGLPDVMLDDLGNRLEFCEVANGAAMYIQALQEISHCADLAHRSTVENQRLETRARMRSLIDRSPKVDGFDADIMQEALSNLDVSAECRGLPYAALVAKSPSHLEWICLMHKLAFSLGISCGLWTKQDLYHSLKPGRAPQLFGSYRVIGLNSAHGRLQEELIYAQQAGLWSGTGAFQEGKSQCLIVVAADLCIAALRFAQRLPFGICFCDRKEAFDTQWRASMMVRLADCVSEPRWWCIADDLLDTTFMSVVQGRHRSTWFSSNTGVVEGRKLSPVEFCIGQAVLEEYALVQLWGLGLDPPAEAVAAYHMHKDGSSGLYDVPLISSLLGMAQSSSLSWSEVMRVAPHDTIRLALLDAASSVRRHVRSFVDDTRVPVASHGHAVAAFKTLEEVASLEQYLYKPGKNHIVACGFQHRAPIPLQGSTVEYTEEATQLGCSVNMQFDGSAHLQFILSRGPGKMFQLMGELVSLGLPFAAVRASLMNRVLPSAAFGIELVVHVPGFEKKLNSLQAFWLRKALGCGQIPRVVLMREFGALDRLSAMAWIRAIALRYRVLADPRYDQEKTIMSLAAAEPSSWAAHVDSHIQFLSVPPLPVDLLSTELQPAQRKAKLHHFVQSVVQPTIRAWERTDWHLAKRNEQHWVQFSFSDWTIADMDHFQFPIPAAQAWVQLKLHGFFFDGSPVPSSPCGLCKKEALECVEHLFFDCLVARKLIGPLLDKSDEVTKFHVGANLPDLSSVGEWVYAAWNLWRQRRS